MKSEMKFCPLASGSSGNCVYIGSKETHLLIDAGLSGKRIETAMTTIKVPHLNGIFITHEHSDHASGAGIMSRRFGLPVFATPKTWRYFQRHGTIGKVADDLQRIVEPNVPIKIGDMEVTPFEIPHDASQPVGYYLRSIGDGSVDDSTSFKAAVATDMGYVTDTVRAILRDAHVMLIESNHDVEMLENGSYPRMLKDRVKGSRGHLSNVAAGALLAEIATYEHCNCRHVFLGHLSEENNRPMIALDTVESILEANGVQLKVSVAERHEPSEMVELVHK